VKNESITQVHDSYINSDDLELILVQTNLNPSKWVTADHITKIQYEKLRNRNITDQDCNTDKGNVYSCSVKCKTRGVLLAATNCGIVVGFREIYGGEGLRQVGLFYLDVLDNFQSNN